MTTAKFRGPLNVVLLLLFIALLPASVRGQSFPDLRVVVGNALHLHGDEAIRTWDFGDADGEFGELTGYNAAHVYDKEGNYKVKESDPDGSNATTRLLRVLPDERRVVKLPADTDLVAVFKQFKGDTRLLLPCGADFQVREPIPIKFANMALGSYGEGLRPRIVHIGSRSAVFSVDAANFSVSGIEFDTDAPLKTSPAKVTRHGLFIRSGSASVRDCTFRNMDDGITCSPRTIALLVQDCTFTDEMRSCSVWIDGHDIVLLGNTSDASYHEHNVRASMPEIKRVLVHGNDFTRRPVRSKESLTLRDGQWMYVSDNTFRYGWVQCSEGKPHEETVCRHIVFDGNTLIEGAFFQINPGAKDVRVTHNRIYCDPNTEPVHVTGPYVGDVLINDNIRIVKSPTSKPFVQLHNSPVGVTEEGNRTVIQPVRE